MQRKMNYKSLFSKKNNNSSQPQSSWKPLDDLIHPQPAKPAPAKQPQSSWKPLDNLTRPAQPKPKTSNASSPHNSSQQAGGASTTYTHHYTSHRSSGGVGSGGVSWEKPVEPPKEHPNDPHYHSVTVEGPKAPDYSPDPYVGYVEMTSHGGVSKPLPRPTHSAFEAEQELKEIRRREKVARLRKALHMESPFYSDEQVLKRYEGLKELSRATGEVRSARSGHRLKDWWRGLLVYAGSPDTSNSVGSHLKHAAANAAVGAVEGGGDLVLGLPSLVVGAGRSAVRGGKAAAGFIASDLKSKGVVGTVKDIGRSNVDFWVGVPAFASRASEKAYGSGQVFGSSLKSNPDVAVKVGGRLATDILVPKAVAEGVPKAKRALFGAERKYYDSYDVVAVSDEEGVVGWSLKPSKGANLLKEGGHRVRSSRLVSLEVDNGKVMTHNPNVGGSVVGDDFVPTVDLDSGRVLKPETPKNMFFKGKVSFKPSVSSDSEVVDELLTSKRRGGAGLTVAFDTPKSASFKRGGGFAVDGSWVGASDADYSDFGFDILRIDRGSGGSVVLENKLPLKTLWKRRAYKFLRSKGLMSSSSKDGEIVIDLDELYRSESPNRGVGGVVASMLKDKRASSTTPVLPEKQVFKQVVRRGGSVAKVSSSNLFVVEPVKPLRGASAVSAAATVSTLRRGGGAASASESGRLSVGLVNEKSKGLKLVTVPSPVFVPSESARSKSREPLVVPTLKIGGVEMVSEKVSGVSAQKPGLVEKVFLTEEVSEKSREKVSPETSLKNVQVLKGVSLADFASGEVLKKKFKLPPAPNAGFSFGSVAGGSKKRGEDYFEKINLFKSPSVGKVFKDANGKSKSGKSKKKKRVKVLSFTNLVGGGLKWNF